MLVNPSMPPASITMYGASTAPPGWLLCDGTAVSRATYATLFSVIGTTFGVGDGSTTFNVPNTQGVFVRGSGSQTISAISYSGTLGTVQGDQIQGHKHSVTDPGHTHTYSIANHSTDATAGANRVTSLDNQVGVATGSNTTGLTVGTPTTDSTNGTPRTGSETQPANIGLTYIIKF